MKQKEYNFFCPLVEDFLGDNAAVGWTGLGGSIESSSELVSSPE